MKKSPAFPHIAGQGRHPLYKGDKKIPHLLCRKQGIVHRLRWPRPEDRARHDGPLWFALLSEAKSRERSESGPLVPRPSSLVPRTLRYWRSFDTGGRLPYGRDVPRPTQDDRQLRVTLAHHSSLVTRHSPQEITTFIVDEKGPFLLGSDELVQRAYTSRKVPTSSRANCSVKRALVL